LGCWPGSVHPPAHPPAPHPPTHQVLKQFNRPGSDKSSSGYVRSLAMDPEGMYVAAVQVRGLRCWPPAHGALPCSSPHPPPPPTPTPARPS
jgi:hypothetical protein